MIFFLILSSQYVKREDVILMAGCGNSRLTEDMYEDGMNCKCGFNVIIVTPIELVS